MSAWDGVGPKRRGGRVSEIPGIEWNLSRPASDLRELKSRSAVLPPNEAIEPHVGSGIQHKAGWLLRGLLLIWVGATSAAHAQTNEQTRTDCADPNPTTRIRACSIIIKSGQSSDLNTPVAYNNRGLAYNETNQPELAIADFDQAIAIFPSYAIAYSNRGLAHENAGQTERAISDFDQALKFNPNYAGAYNNRCYAKAVLGQLKDALTDCQKALTLAPQDAKTLDSLAYVYLRLGEYRQAIDNYDAALKISPNLVESIYGRGSAKLKTGDNVSGTSDLDAAVKADPGIVARMAAIGVTR
jgi:tetratricopeptide (TPR) repeat protein